MGIVTPIRVLHVIGGMDRAGAETMIMNLYRNIDREKVQFDFLIHTEKRCDYEEEIEKMGGNIYRIKRFTGFNAISYYRQCRSFFNQHKYKIVHGHIGSCAALYLTAAKRNGCYTIAHSHNTYEKKISMHNAVYKFFSFFTRYVADYFFGCSSEAGLSRYGKKVVSSSKFTLFHNAIEVDKFSYDESIRRSIREKMGLRDCFVIGATGRLNYQKNPFGIVNILYETKKIKSNTRLLWIGNYDTDIGRDALEYAKELDVRDSIILTGVVSNVNEMLQAMDCFIMPSFFEGLGIAAIEAQAAGLPCFLSDRMPQEVHIVENSKFLSIDSPKVWAKKISECNIERVDTSQQIKDAGYDIYETAKWLQEFYLSLQA